MHRFLSLILALAALNLEAATRDLLRQPPAWLASEAGRCAVSNLLSWQSDLGAWPKNMDPTAAPYAGTNRARDVKGTFDNGATTDELRLLARAFGVTGEPAVRAAVERGVDHILKAQYPNGGWPQSYPPGPKYHRHITFNDGAMVRLLEFLREVREAPAFAFLDEARRRAADDAFARGIACILRCQVRQQGVLTAWCAQHDEVDFAPRPARTYELASLSGSESVGIVRLLMSLERPTPGTVQAIEGAVAWFRRMKIEGHRLERVADPLGPGGRNLVLVPDAAAAPLWARFYELETGRPLFVDRDGVPRYELAAIGYERRNGYAWLGDWPAALLARDYPAWRQKHPVAP